MGGIDQLGSELYEIQQTKHLPQSSVSTENPQKTTSLLQAPDTIYTITLDEIFEEGCFTQGKKSNSSILIVLCVVFMCYALIYRRSARFQTYNQEKVASVTGWFRVRLRVKEHASKVEEADTELSKRQEGNTTLEDNLEYDSLS